MPGILKTETQAPEINHTFSSAGSYSVKLTVTDNEEATETTTQTITVTETPSSPIIHSFTADQTSITEGENASLSWQVTDAATVTIDQGVGSVALSGSTSVYPAV
jgi:PKD repeat protein